MELLIVLVLLSIIVMCGATAWRMWQAGQAMRELRAIVPGAVADLVASQTPYKEDPERG